MISLKLSIAEQKLQVWKGNQLIRNYFISSAANGVGEEFGSFKTPRGLHTIRAKIGAGQPANTVFVKRRPTGELYTPDLRSTNPDRDWILTRIFWLSGLEPGKNRLGKVDTMRRFIYIHGTPDDVTLGLPGSKGCIRMHNQDIIELFELVPLGATLFIQEHAF